MKTGEFQKVYEYIHDMSQSNATMYIPKVWNKYIGYTNYQENDKDEICVNTYEFYQKVLERIIELESPTIYELKQSQIYCAMPRYSTAWDIDHTGNLNHGTFFRLMILLPMLHFTGNNILYLLPINEYSNKNKKGDIGSPFAIKDFYKLDANLHDSLLDGIETFTLDDELHALVQACHIMGIRIVIDFIPRVTARDCNIIKDHPDWVYWIRKEYEKEFKTPEIPGLDFFQECTMENLQLVYTAESTKKHISNFVLPPSDLNPVLWEEIKRESAEKSIDLFDLIEERMGITTMSAHSDWINDVQPIWTDITFWKLYMDNQPLAQQYLDKNQAPYVMFDTIKANKFPATIPNKELWDMFDEVLKYYVNVFDLDGFRFDIGHTLPPELLGHLFDTVKEYKKNAIFISEDLFNRNHESAAKTGYNIMLGSSWREVANLTKDAYTQFVKELSELKLYAYACAETHDTPRIVSRKSGKELARSLAIVNSFLPHGIPFMLTGYEAGEEQPMNCGLADNTGGAPIKKAFFNSIGIDWTKDGVSEFIDYLEKIYTLRVTYDKLTPFDAFELIETEMAILVFTYTCKNIVVIFNYNLEQPTVVDCDLLGINLREYEIKLLSDCDSSVIAQEENLIELSVGGTVILKKYNSNGGI